MKFSMLTIGLVVALAYVMGDSGQTLALGMFIAGAGAVYPFLAPILVGSARTSPDPIPPPTSCSLAYRAVWDNRSVLGHILVWKACGICWLVRAHPAVSSAR